MRVLQDITSKTEVAENVAAGRKECCGAVYCVRVYIVGVLQNLATLSIVHGSSTPFISATLLMMSYGFLWCCLERPQQSSCCMKLTVGPHPLVW